MTTRSSSAALLALAVAVLAQSASAQTPADFESARTLYREAREARDRGDWPTALAKFKAAHTLAATPITAFEYGGALIATGELAEGREVLLSVARLPRRPDESPKASAARDSAAKLASEVKGRLATVTFKLPPGAGVRLDVDGVAVSDAALGIPRIMNPGKHAIVARTNDKRARFEIDLREGESREVEVPTPNERVETPTPPTSPDGGSPSKLGPAAEDDALAHRPQTRRTHPLTYVGLVTTGVGVGVGTVTGAMTLSQASTLKSDCPGGRCPPDTHDALHRASALGTTATIAFAVAGVGAVLLVTGLLISGGEERPKTASLGTWVFP
jgi:hypothetical protein